MPVWFMQIFTAMKRQLEISHEPDCTLMGFKNERITWNQVILRSARPALIQDLLA